VLLPFSCWLLLLAKPTLVPFNGRWWQALPTTARRPHHSSIHHLHHSSFLVLASKCRALSHARGREKRKMSETTTRAGPTERALTRAEFRQLWGISKSTYDKMRSEGLAPEETVIDLPGWNLVRISPEAIRKWLQRLAEVRQSKEAQLERDRRQAQVVAAAKLAVASPAHVSKRAHRRGGRR
jgi:hypothetical protein